MSAELHPQFYLVLQWSAHSLCDHCRVLSAFLIVSLQSLVACLKKTEELYSCYQWECHILEDTASSCHVQHHQIVQFFRLLFKRMRRSCFSITLHQHFPFWPSLDCWSSCDTLIAVAQLVKNPPATQEACIQSLGWEDPWRRERQPTPVFLPGKYSMDREAWRATVHGVARSWTWLSTNTFSFMCYQYLHWLHSALRPWTEPSSESCCPVFSFPCSFTAIPSIIP